MSKDKNTEIIQNNWVKKYQQTVWSKLSEKNQRKLCKRFNLHYKKNKALPYLLKQLRLPMPPLSFTIASMRLAKYWDDSLLQSNPYTKQWMQKITYDIDGFGVRRVHSKPYGIYIDTPLSRKKQILLEQALKSSVSLNKKEKIRVLNATQELSMFQLTELLKTFQNEVTKMTLLCLEDNENIEKLRKQAEKEWFDIVANLDYYVSGNNNPHIILDKKKNLVPQSIEYSIKQSVKGQDIAVKKIATLLYYQQRLFEAHTSNKDVLPFPPLDPILLSGATGTGKSFLIENACDIVGLPFLVVDASSLVSEGIRGYTVNDILKDMLRKTNYNVKEAETSIIVFDEVDKLLSHHDGESILFQLLRLVEGSNISIDKSYNENTEFSQIFRISTKNILFLFAGSFQNLIEEKGKKSGFIHEPEEENKTLTMHDIERTALPKELLGRINDVIVLNKLNKETYKEILLESKKSPIKKYQQMLAFNDKSNNLSKEDIKNIIDQAIQSPYGARTLNKLIYKYFEEMLFQAPVRHDTSL